MFESLEKLIEKYGLWFIAVPILLVVCIVAFAHIMSADGSNNKDTHNKDV